MSTEDYKKLRKSVFRKLEKSEDPVIDAMTLAADIMVTLMLHHKDDVIAKSLIDAFKKDVESSYNQITGSADHG